MFKHFLISLAVLILLLAGGSYYVYSHRQVLAEKAVSYAMERITGGAAEAQDDEPKTWLANLLGSGSDDMKKALMTAVVNKGINAVSGQGNTASASQTNKPTMSPGLATMADMLANGASGENNADLVQMAQMLASTLGVNAGQQSSGRYENVQHDINARDSKGRTLLMNVCRTDVSAKVLKMIIKYGADLNAQDQGGRTALMYAAALNEDPDVISLLINAGADSEISDYEGKTAYDYAADNRIKNILSPAR